MKVAIVSDLHLGYERFYDDAYTQASEALTKASEIADAIIIPGDIFDFRSPKPDVIAQGLNIFRQLKDKMWEARITKYSGQGRIFTDIPVIAIPGTHERRAQDSENAVEIMNLAGFLANGSEATIEISKGAEKISVSSLGGVSEERVKDMLKEYSFSPVPGQFSIFMLHQSIYELLPFSDEFICYDDLPKGFDLYVSGHIHSKVIAKVHGKPFLIPGSTVLTQLKDGEQEPKGFFVFDTQTNEYKFHEISSRKFMVEKIDISDKDPSQIKMEVVEKLAKATKSKVQNKPIIRIVLEGRSNESTKQISMEISEIIKNETNAVVELSKGNVENYEMESNIESLRQKSIENLSIKDYGMVLFLERLKDNNYKLGVSASELFDMLTADTNKEKVIKKATDIVLESTPP